MKSVAPLHPARFSDALLETFGPLLADCRTVLDPFAGTGRIHELEGFETFGVEIEPEWAAMHPRTIVGDARHLPFPDESFDAICTSPTFGNRLADHHEARDGSIRRSYTHDLGRKLADANSGAMHWGPKYRAFHRRAWHEAVRVLKPGGTFVLNIKDHVRGGERQPVSGWHVGHLQRLGLIVVDVVVVSSRGMRMGANSQARVEAELVVEMRK